MFAYRAIRTTLLLNALLLTACSTVSKSVSTEPAAQQTTPVTQPAPDLHPAQAICDQLTTQFQTQLPAPILNLMHWQVGLMQNPLVTQPAVVPTCQLRLSTDGATIEKLGLTPQFMVATLERLDWAQNAETNQYAASSPTAGRLVMMHDHATAVMDYQYAPPKNACPSNAPIAACKVPRKKWLYQLSMAVLGDVVK